MSQLPVVARRIREIRESKKLSRTQLAEKLDTTRLHVWRIETGHRELVASEIPRWADALGTTVASLFRKAS